MVVLRRVESSPLGPDAWTEVNRRFYAASTEVADTLTDAVSVLDPSARYITLNLWIHSEVSDNESVMWRFQDVPEDQFEQGDVRLPAIAEQWSADEMRDVAAEVFAAMLARLEELRGWPSGTADDLMRDLGSRGAVPQIVYQPPPPIDLRVGGDRQRPRRSHRQTPPRAGCVSGIRGPPSPSERLLPERLDHSFYVAAHRILWSVFTMVAPLGLHEMIVPGFPVSRAAK